MTGWLDFLRKKTRKNSQGTEDLLRVFRKKYSNFKELLDSNAELLKIITDIEEKLNGRDVFGMSYVRSQCTRSVFHTMRMVKSFDKLCHGKYPLLEQALNSINSQIKAILDQKRTTPVKELILPYSAIGVETADAVGGKNANLGETANKAGLPTPRGFAVTTAAYALFLSETGLDQEINRRMMELSSEDPDAIVGLSEEIQSLFMNARTPERLKGELLSAYDKVFGGDDIGHGTKIAMRSSAIGEDGPLSFAGQYLSVMNVPRSQIERNYKLILASLFTPRAMSYRLSNGVSSEDTAMSVACLEMIDPVSSGVMYSRHPFDPGRDKVILNAVFGLGAYAVDGKVSPDEYILSKTDPPRLEDSLIPVKPVKLALKPEGFVHQEKVDPDLAGTACLTREQAETLAGYAVILENHYKCPQDVEWALDRSGKLVILQTRPLKLETPPAGVSLEQSPPLPGRRVLIEGGEVASPGIGVGPARLVRSEQDLMDFPQGAVLVARHSSPKFMIVLRKAAAVVTDFGSVTGHMASLVREFKVPALLNAKTAAQTITPGEIITVDALSGRIYQGEVKELIPPQSESEPIMIGTPVHNLLKQTAELIIPLNLLDPKARYFEPKSCRTLHDIMRLVHEFSYGEMFKISDLTASDGGFAFKLDASIPLDLHIIDVGKGLCDIPPGTKTIRVDQILSIPFKALLHGMLHQDLCRQEPKPVNLKGFFSVMSQQMTAPPNISVERFGDRSYAIISDKYLNFSSRVGYHYSVLDCYCGQTVNKNYISFQFKGGAADDVRRGRRARAIALTLEKLGFNVETTGDRVSARFQKYEAEETKDRLDQLGRLLQFTRQMDMLMHNENSVHELSRRFLEEDYRHEPA